MTMSNGIWQYSLRCPSCGYFRGWVHHLFENRIYQVIFCPCSTGEHP